MGFSPLDDLLLVHDSDVSFTMGMSDQEQKISFLQIFLLTVGKTLIFLF